MLRHQLLAISFIFLGLAQMQAQIELSVSSHDDLTAGELITATVEVKGYDLISSGQFELSFDAAVVEIVDLRIPVDSTPVGGPSPYAISQLDSSVRWLYIDNDGTGDNGRLPDGSKLLEVTLRAIGNPGDSSCLSIGNGGLATEFIKSASQELDVFVNKGSVHLRQSSSISSHEQQKLTSAWAGNSTLSVFYAPALHAATLQVVSLDGKAVATQPVAINSTSTTFHLPELVQAQLLVLRYVETHSQSAILIKGPR